MKRRTFIQAVLGLFAAPVLPEVSLPEVAAAEELTTFSVPIRIYQLRSTSALGTGSLRDLYKEELSEWFVREFDRRMFEALTGDAK